MFAHVNERTIISLDGDKLIRMWGLFEGGGEEVFTAAQPKRILVGTDSQPIALFALQGGLGVLQHVPRRRRPPVSRKPAHLHRIHAYVAICP